MSEENPPQKPKIDKISAPISEIHSLPELNWKEEEIIKLANYLFELARSRAQEKQTLEQKSEEEIIKPTVEIHEDQIDRILEDATIDIAKAVEEEGYPLPPEEQEKIQEIEEIIHKEKIPQPTSIKSEVESTVTTTKPEVIEQITEEAIKDVEVLESVQEEIEEITEVVAPLEELEAAEIEVSEPVTEFEERKTTEMEVVAPLE
ncbi:MAG: hypothetical protein ACTSYD_11335, partial [Candidatus Heimdallarchaeaceae archaeon]